jgi:predicted transcriptional regulator
MPAILHFPSCLDIQKDCYAKRMRSPFVFTRDILLMEQNGLAPKRIEIISRPPTTQSYPFLSEITRGRDRCASSPTIVSETGIVRKVHRRTLKNRSRAEIVSAILEVARSGVLRTHLLFRTYMSSEQLREYLDMLLENDMLECDQTRHLYFTTERGIEFLTAYNEVGSTINVRRRNGDFQQS